MTSLTGDEPDLELGASGEGVMLLQVRLYALGLYRQIPDGTFNMITENAVRELQSSVGHDNNGEVTRDTWEALVHQEIQAGILYRYLSPYDALTQIRYDLEHPAVEETVSEDGQWRWDGAEWLPVDGAAGWAGDFGASGNDEYAGLLSPDGQWRWDGSEWQPATTDGTQQSDVNRASGGQLSADGQWRWDGTEWQPAGATSAAAASAVSDDYTGMVSEDGQWRWTGSQWEPA